MTRPARRDCLVLGAGAAVVFALQAVAWPLHAGRDLGSYVLYYNQLWDALPEWHTLMVYRTPVAPLFVGGLYRLGGTALLELTLGVLFVASVVGVYVLGTLWSRPVALASAALTALYPTYGALFHELASDNLLAAGLALWGALVARTWRRPTLAGYAAHGVAVFLLVLVRPAAQTLLGFALLPLLQPGFGLRTRLLRATAFLGTAGVLLVAWAGYNALRYDDFTVARGSVAVVPLYRVFVMERLVRADNGPASALLARAVADDLLPREPYRGLGLDVPRVLASGDSRVWSDLAALTDRRFGWDTDHAILRRVALEAIRRDPLAYLKGVAASIAFTFRDELRPAAPRRWRPPPPGAAPAAFVPHDGQIVPHSHVHWLRSAPETPLSPARGPRPWAGPWRVDLGEETLPVRDGSPAVTALFDRGVGRLYPPILLFLGLGAAGVLLSRHPASRLFLFLAALAVAHVVFICASTSLAVQYRVPFDPFWIILGVAGFVRYGFGGRPGSPDAR
jgi:hypothetical protein